MLTFLKNGSVFLTLCIALFFSATSIKTGDELNPPMTLSFRDTSTQYQITNRRVLHFFPLLENAYNNGKTHYQMHQMHKPIIISILLQLVQEYITYNSFATPNSTALINQMNTSDLLSALQVAQNLKTPDTLLQFLSHIIAQRKAQETEATQPEQQQPMMLTPPPAAFSKTIPVIVGEKRFDLDIS